MRPLIPEQLERAGYQLQSTHQAGPVGIRCVVDTIAGGLVRLVDVVTIGESQMTRYLCENAGAFQGLADHPLIVKQLDTGWLTERTYFQVLDLAPDACAIGHVWPARELDGEELWAVASHIVAALEHLREHGAIHGALAPSTIYLDDENVRLGEFWWSHRSDEQPHHPSLAGYTRDMWPSSLLPFLAPEVLVGAPPAQESDIYGLGAVLFFALTGRNHRNVVLMGNPEEDRSALLNSPSVSLQALRPDLGDTACSLIHSMLDDDLFSRPDLSALEKTVTRLCHPQPPARFQVEGWESGRRAQVQEACRSSQLIGERISSILGTSSIGAVDPGQLVSIRDVWQDGDVVRLAIMHPVTAAVADYRTAWLLKGGWGTFAVLQPEPDVAADGQPADQTLVKVIAPRTLQTLAPREFARVMLEFAAEASANGRLELAETSEVFGKLGGKEAPVKAAKVGESIGLTNRLSVGLHAVRPETSLSVMERWEEHGFHFIVVQDCESGEEAEFAVRWLIPSGGQRYAILMHPPELAAGSAITPWILVKILDPNVIATISDQESDLMVEACTSIMNRHISGHTPDIEEVLGMFLCTP